MGGSTGKQIGDAADKVSKQISGIMSKICVTSQVNKILTTADQINQWTFGGLSSLSPTGKAEQIALIKSKITQLTTARTCIQAQIDDLNKVSPISVLQAQQVQTALDGLTKQKNTIDLRVDALNDQLNIATQSLWKTILIASLLSVSKSLSTTMVNKLVNNYKINDFTKYAEAVATQVYDNEFIQNNSSGSAADQLILRSMLTNPVAQSEIQSAVYQRASDSLGFIPSTVDSSSNNSNFYIQMANVGTAGNSPFVQQMVLADAAQRSHSQAVSTAQAEIAQSNGLKTPRTCGATLQQQKTIDASYKAANDKVQYQQKELTRLQDSRDSGLTVKDSDIAQAQADLNTAIKQMQAVPNNSLDAKGNAAIDICTAITSPPSLINQGINEAFKAITNNMYNYNSDNLPEFVNIISGIASQVSNSLIFGGNNSASKILDENLAPAAAAASYAVNFATAELQNKESNGLSITVTRTDDGSKTGSATYSIKWDAKSVDGANLTTVIGPGLPLNTSGLISASLTGATTATVSTTGTLTFTAVAYGVNKSDVKASVSVQVNPSQVAGASIARPLESIRGPSVNQVVAISPRGN